MPKGRLQAVAAAFEARSELLRTKFLSMTTDHACTECWSAGLGEAVLSAWLQTTWGDFTRELIIASAQGTRRTQGNSVLAAPGVKSRSDAERIVKVASTSAFKNRGLGSPIWHAPWFAIDVGTRISVRNLETLRPILGSSVVPKQITDFRNYLVHPGIYTRSKYEELREQLGLFGVEPEHLLRRQSESHDMVFTIWIDELQRIAHASTI